MIICIHVYMIICIHVYMKIMYTYTITRIK